VRGLVRGFNYRLSKSLQHTVGSVWGQYLQGFEDGRSGAQPSELIQSGGGSIVGGRGNWRKNEWRVRLRGSGSSGAMTASVKTQRRS
jgi:hypothetical protein